MRLFDTHAHLTDARYDADRAELISTFHADGVQCVLTCGTDLRDSRAAIALCEQYSDLYCAVGIHPHESAHCPSDYLAQLRDLLTHPKAVALGEIGLDYHYDFAPRAVQQEVFFAQLALACSLDMPVVLHDREAHADMLRILQGFAGKHKGVMHCYSGSAEMVPDYLALGLHFGVGGSVTFKNAQKTRAAVQAMPLDRILLETDCPYLTPVPFRSQRNQPKNTALVCQTIAQLLDLPPAHVAQRTTDNAIRVFLKPV